MVGVTSEGELVQCIQMSGYYQKAGISPGNVRKRKLSGLLSDSIYMNEIGTELAALYKANKTRGVPCAGTCNHKRTLLKDYLQICISL